MDDIVLPAPEADGTFCAGRNYLYAVDMAGYVCVQWIVVSGPVAAQPFTANVYLSSPQGASTVVRVPIGGEYCIIARRKRAA